jgi:hypothetical protein
MPMVANGYGVTLVPEVAIDVEVRDERVKLLRFARPEPGRMIGLGWRRTSPRKVDFVALGQLITEALGFTERRKAAKPRLPRPEIGKARGGRERRRLEALGVGRAGLVEERGAIPPLLRLSANDTISRTLDVTASDCTSFWSCEGFRMLAALRGKSFVTASIRKPSHYRKIRRGLWDYLVGTQ